MTKILTHVSGSIIIMLFLFSPFFATGDIVSEEVESKKEQPNIEKVREEPVNEEFTVLEKVEGKREQPNIEQVREEPVNEEFTLERYPPENRSNYTHENDEDSMEFVVAIYFGEASWYGEKFDGRKTANGEIYNMDDLTAAHNVIPFDTRVRVTYLETGKDVIVRINDRGPFEPESVGGDLIPHNTRIIDLSKRAAEEIGLKDPGVGDVRIEILSH